MLHLQGPCSGQFSGRVPSIRQARRPDISSADSRNVDPLMGVFIRGPFPAELPAEATASKSCGLTRVAEDENT